jgi:UDPglucose--hexose-1-phosphate uridylyltransferase
MRGRILSSAEAAGTFDDAQAVRQKERNPRHALPSVGGEHTMACMHRNEMRLDPLTDEWTLFSESRAHQPTAPSVLEEHSAQAAANPFIGGFEHYVPHTLYQAEAHNGGRVRVVPNRAPVLRVEGDATRHGEGFYDHMDGVGAHEVIIETADSRALETLGAAHIVEVVRAWKARMVDLMRDVRLRSFSIVKSVGRPAGALLPHSASQLVAMAVIPSRLKRKLEVARAFYQHKKRSIFEDILGEEIRTGTRIVYENNGFCGFCPYASRSPFELVVYPKRQVCDFHATTEEEAVQLADVIHVALTKINGALDHPPYQLMLSTAPTRTTRQDHWSTLERDFRWHIEIVPRLYPPSALELATGSWVNGVWPEVAAEYLRGIKVPE